MRQRTRSTGEYDTPSESTSSSPVDLESVFSNTVLFKKTKLIYDLTEIYDIYFDDVADVEIPESPPSMIPRSSWVLTRNYDSGYYAAYGFRDVVESSGDESYETSLVLAEEDTEERTFDHLWVFLLMLLNNRGRTETLVFKTDLLILPPK